MNELPKARDAQFFILWHFPEVVLHYVQHFAATVQLMSWSLSY